MREFSQSEKNVMRGKLLFGANINEILSQEFIENVRFEIKIDHSANKLHQIKYYSDNYDVEKAQRELINLMNLLNYLLGYAFIQTVSSAATDFQSYTIPDQITIGRSSSNVCKTYLFPPESTITVELLTKYLYTKFEPTAKLIELVNRDFKTVEEKQHSENIGQQKLTNIFSGLGFAVALISLIISYTQSQSIDSLSYKVATHEERINSLLKNRSIDSLSLERLQESNRILKFRLDSLRHFLSKPKKKKSTN